MDYETGSLWSQITGQAISGPLRGCQLEAMPSEHTTWSQWKKQHPNGLVLSKLRSPRGSYGADPYAGYYRAERAGAFGPASVDPRLEARQYVLGIALHGQARAYPYRLLRDNPVINDVVGGTPVLVVFSRANESAIVFERYTATSVELTFDLAPDDGDDLVLVDRESGSRWDARSGQAISGPWKGQAIERLPSTSSLWLAWRSLYPHSGVYGERAQS